MSNPLSTLLDTVPRHARLSDYLEAPADHADAAIEDMVIDYATLRRGVATTSLGLRNAGVRQGDVVAMLADPGIEFWTVFLATVRVGAVWLGLGPRSTDAELAETIADASPTLLVASAAHSHRLPASLSSTALAVATSVPELDTSDPDQPCLIVYTSGSSGRRKGALISQRALIGGAARRVAAWAPRPMRTLVNLPINHIGAVGDLCVTTLVSGGCLSFMPRFDAAETLPRIARDRVTFWYQVPTMFEKALAASDPHAHDLSSLDTVAWSGAPAAAPLVDRLAALFPSKLATDYSMTESVGAITLAPRGTDPALLIGSPGWPDPTRAITLDEAGQVLVGDDLCFSGYLGHTAATSPLATSDVGEWLSDGRLRLIGRTTDMYKSGGYNVYPREVEAALEALPGVTRAAVIGVPDEHWGEVGVAFVEGTADPDELRGQVRETLADYKCPKRWHRLERLPTLAIGKIDRATLRRLALTNS